MNGAEIRGAQRGGQELQGVLYGAREHSLKAVLMGLVAG